MSEKSFAMSLKRKRGPGHSVLDQAQKGGSIARTQYINHLKMGQHPRSLSANMYSYVPHNRSGVSHVMKSDFKSRFESRNLNHYHHNMRKYNKGKEPNQIKAFLKTIQS